MIGRTVSHYRIVSEIGHGGMGVVYRANDLLLDRPVAIKFLAPHLNADPEARQRFLQEARALASFEHPSICTVFEIGTEEDSGLFIAMALLEGMTLKERIAGGPLSPGETVSIARPIADALKEAHRKGITHRDIKPANIMLTNRGRPVILDFGLAHLADASQLTRSGVAIGTVCYMSPEQVRGERADHRSDIWSLGVVLYEMLTASRPFHGETASAVCFAIQHLDPEPIENAVVGLPVQLLDIVDRCLQKDPARRYEQTGELAADLASVTESLQTEVHRKTAPRRTGPRKRSRTPGFRIAILVLMATMIAGGHLYGVRKDRQEDASSSKIRSLAVLPFTDLRPEYGHSHFVDGMHEALITDLARHSDLKIISRTSVQRYRDTTVPLRKIAQELNVDAFIEGAVLREGHRIRISANLIDAATERQMWAQNYERDATEVLRLQRQVAEAIVSELGAALIVGRGDRKQTVISLAPEAFEAYALGRHHVGRRTRDDVTTAISYFERAVAIAPDFAEAYAGLADAHAVAAINDLLPQESSFARAREEAAIALSLNHELASAHTSLAFVQLYYDWDRTAAARSYRNALRCDPSYAIARQWYAIFLEQEGRFDEAIAEIERARALDPMSPVMNANVARRLAIAGRFDEALSAIAHALQLDPQLPFCLSVQAEIYFMQCNHIEEAAALDELAATAGSAEPISPRLLSALRENGEAGFYKERLALARDPSSPATRYHADIIELSCLAQMGGVDDVFAVIAGWFECHNSGLHWLKTYPLLEPIRTDPRYGQVLERISLQP